MLLSNDDKNILEEIVETSGHCLKASRCKACPFRAMCLPEFLNPSPPTPPQRLDIAVGVLMHNAVIDEDIDLKNYTLRK
jgi:hypothetical protein